MGFDKCNNVVYSLRNNGNRNWASTDQYPYPNKQQVTGTAYIGLSAGGNDVMFLYLVQTPLFFINTGKFDLSIPYKGQGFSMSTRIKGINVGLSAGGKTERITECSPVCGVWGPSSHGDVNPNNADKKHSNGWTFWNIGCLRLSTYLLGGRWHGHSSPTAAAREIGVDQLHDKGSLFADGRSQHGKHLPFEDGRLSTSRRWHIYDTKCVDG